MIRWLRSLVRPAPPAAMGTVPGYLWDVGAKRWVAVEAATKTRHDAYSEVGPVYRITGLQP